MIATSTQSNGLSKARKRSKELTSSKLESIKTNLSTDYSYIVFEIYDANQNGNSDYAYLIDELRQHQPGTLDFKVYSDDKTAEKLLVVKLDPDHHDDSMQILFGLLLPDNIRFYVYESKSDLGNNHALN